MLRCDSLLTLSILERRYQISIGSKIVVRFCWIERPNSLFSTISNLMDSGSSVFDGSIDNFCVGVGSCSELAIAGVAGGVVSSSVS